MEENKEQALALAIEIIEEIGIALERSGPMSAGGYECQSCGTNLSYSKGRHTNDCKLAKFFYILGIENKKQKRLIG